MLYALINEMDFWGLYPTKQIYDDPFYMPSCECFELHDFATMLNKKKSKNNSCDGLWLCTVLYYERADGDMLYNCNLGIARDLTRYSTFGYLEKYLGLDILADSEYLPIMSGSFCDEKIVQEMLDKCKFSKQRLNAILLNAIKDEKFNKFIPQIISLGADINDCEYDALAEAYKSNNVEVLKLLLNSLKIKPETIQKILSCHAFQNQYTINSRNYLKKVANYLQ